MSNNEWDSEDREALCRAVRFLEFSSFLMSVMDLLGWPIEKFAEAVSSPRVQQMAKDVLLRLLRVAMKGLRHDSGRPSDRLLRWTTGMLGGVSGVGGLVGLIIELPVTTGIMLRSIADIARSEGGDIDDLKTRLNCLAVFALSSSSQQTDGAESPYYRLRKDLDRDILAAVAQMAAFRGALVNVLKGQLPQVVAKLLDRIAVRFGEVVAEKLVAQGLPVIGAVGGMTINLVFMTEFQKKAHGHFTVLRLERKFGPQAVRAEYEKCWTTIRTTGHSEFE